MEFLYFKNSINKKYTASIKFSCEMIKVFLLRPGTRQACLLSPFHSTLNWRSQTVQRGNIAIIEKRETIGKEEIKNNTFSLFTDDMCLCSQTFQKRNVNGTAILENNMEVKHTQIELPYHIANSSSDCLSEGNWMTISKRYLQSSKFPVLHNRFLLAIYFIWN